MGGIDWTTDQGSKDYAGRRVALVVIDGDDPGTAKLDENRYKGYSDNHFIVGGLHFPSAQRNVFPPVIYTSLGDCTNIEYNNNKEFEAKCQPIHDEAQQKKWTLICLEYVVLGEEKKYVLQYKLELTAVMEKDYVLQPSVDARTLTVMSKSTHASGDADKLKDADAAVE